MFSTQTEILYVFLWWPRYTKWCPIGSIALISTTVTTTPKLSRSENRCECFFIIWKRSLLSMLTLCGKALQNWWKTSQSMKRPLLNLGLRSVNYPFRGTLFTDIFPPFMSQWQHKTVDIESVIILLYFNSNLEIIHLDTCLKKIASLKNFMLLIIEIFVR